MILMLHDIEDNPEGDPPVVRTDRSNGLEQQQWGLIIKAVNIKVEQRVFDIA